MKRETVVLYAGMGAGHLLPMVELAKLFLRHAFSVVVVVVDPPQQAGSSAHVIAQVSAAHPSISFHVLPPVSLPPNPNRDPNAFNTETLRLSGPHLAAFLRSLAASAAASPVRALLLDFFTTDALDIAAELGLPAYIFFPSGAGDLTVFLHLPILDPTTNTSFKDMGGKLIRIPGVPPIRASDMPASVSVRGTDAYKDRMYHFGRLPKARGILINTFESLEPEAVKALRGGLCVPGRSMPPIYCIGPLVAGGEKKGGEGRHECLAWLDSQPKQSVVFLCFGSLGSFRAEQLKEMAVGLERSGQRFLWVVRSPPSDGPAKPFEPRPEPPDLSALLPEGFLDRTGDRGMVVKLWAPQAEVLRHEAVGGFVTHCGWNSVLEALAAGVPMACWPLYAEQRLNKVFLVEDMRVGVEIEGYDKGLVAAEEVEAKVRWLMEAEGGRKLRERVAAFREKGVKALSEGGSSYAAFVEFLGELEGGGGRINGE